MEGLNEKWVRRLTYVYLIPFVIMVCFNTVNSLLRTTYFDLYRDMETAMYKWDTPLLVLILNAVFAAVLYLMWKRGGGNRAGYDKAGIWFGGILCMGIVLLFRCEVSCDSEIVSEIAIQFMEGNYEAFARGEYLYRYPFQLGFTALLEGIYRIFGVRNFVA